MTSAIEKATRVLDRIRECAVHDADCGAQRLPGKHRSDSDRSRACLADHRTTFVVGKRSKRLDEIVSVHPLHILKISTPANVRPFDHGSGAA
jgi:hypothetical protein